MVENEENAEHRMFCLSDVVDESLKMLMPINAYENEPLVPFHTAVRPLLSILRTI